MTGKYRVCLQSTEFSTHLANYSDLAALMAQTSLQRWSWEACLCAKARFPAILPLSYSILEFSVIAGYYLSIFFNWKPSLWT